MKPDEQLYKVTLYDGKTVTVLADCRVDAMRKARLFNVPDKRVSVVEELKC